MSTGYLSDAEARAAILDIGGRMYQRNYVAGNDGNISVKVGEEAIWITPTGVSKGYMKEEELIKVNLAGEILEGKMKATSEGNMHLRAYRENPEIRSVCHAHPPIATACSIAGVDLDVAILPEAVINLGEIPRIPYVQPGSPGVAESMAPYFTSHNALLLAFHGAVTWGNDPYQAYYRMENLEHYASILTQVQYTFQSSNTLKKEEIAGLIELRKKWGVTAGGTPKSGKGGSWVGKG